MECNSDNISNNCSENCDKMDVQESGPLVIPDAKVDKTELGYITSVDHVTRTFYAQFCKYSNHELLFVNKTINEHCEKLFEEHRLNQKKDQTQQKFKSGQVVCAKYSVDNTWYRGWILKKVKKEPICHVFFIDYGNVEIVSSDKLLVVDIPICYREPFGVSCYFTAGESFSDEKWTHFLKMVTNHYLLLKMKERVTSVQYNVDIPLHGYNMKFWGMFLPNRYRAVDTRCPKQCDSRESNMEGVEYNERDKDPLVNSIQQSMQTLMS